MKKSIKLAIMYLATCLILIGVYVYLKEVTKNEYKVLEANVMDINTSGFNVGECVFINEKCELIKATSKDMGAFQIGMVIETNRVAFPEHKTKTIKPCK